MSEAEKEFIKKVDDKVLKASGETLKMVQELDLRTQLNERTFYDAYLKYNYNKKEQNSSKAKISGKSKRK